MPYRHICPSCGHEMDVADRYSGRELFCTQCKAPFTVPTDGAASAVVARCPSCGAELTGAGRFCSVCGGLATGRPPGSVVRPVVVSILAVLQFIGAAAFGLAGLAIVAFHEADGTATAVVIAIAMLAFGGLRLAIGVGLWRLRPWARIVTIVFAILGLLAIPIGTIISGLVLWYMFSPPAKVAFSGRSAGELTPSEAAAMSRQTNVAAIAVAVAMVAVVGVAIMGIIAAIAIPNLINAVNRGRIKRTVTDMETISAELDRYRELHGAIPGGVFSLAELDAALGPERERALPRADGWNRPLEFRSSADGDSWELVSLGRDGQPGRRDGGATENFDDDLVLANDGWWQWPARVGIDSPDDAGLRANPSQISR